MREGWNRATAMLDFTSLELEEFVKPAFKGKKVVARRYAEGGLANTNIQLQLSDTEQPILLRILVRDPEQAQKEYRLNKLIEGRVPAPRIFHFSPENEVTGHPYMLMEWIEGVRLETLVAGMSFDQSSEIGQSVGTALAGIHSIKFAEAGFLDSNLNVADALDMGGRGLLAFAVQCMTSSDLRERLGHDPAIELLLFIERRGDLLDEWKGKPCLTHCDFGGSNILVANSTGHWKVAAVLDWEFAISGTPFFDFGNLLRHPLGSVPGFEESVASGYVQAGGELHPDWRRMSLLTDLTAWLDFLTRPEAGPQLISDARRVIESTIRRLESSS